MRRQGIRNAIRREGAKNKEVRSTRHQRGPVARASKAPGTRVRSTQHRRGPGEVRESEDAKVWAVWEAAHQQQEDTKL